MIRQLSIRRPDDWHVHLREGEMLRAVLPAHATVYGRFVAMPNLSIPVTTRALARAYRAGIFVAMPDGVRAEPLIPCYLTEDTSVEELIAGHQAGDFFGAKFYPVGATTLSRAGVRDIRRLYPLFEVMQKHGVPLLMHGEVVDDDVDFYDRERVFVETSLSDLVRHFPELTMTMEHLTTKEAVDFVADHQHCSRLAGSITLHHLLLTCSDMLNNGLRADYFCYPLVKTASDRAAVRGAATSGRACYFLGTDSAPHLKSQKYCATAKAGIFTAPVSLPGYAAVFEAEGALENLEGFASIYGAEHYGLPVHEDQITLKKTPVQNLPSELSVDADAVRVFSTPTEWHIV
ncbi:MAG: dihydroorotase [Alphaproteobacteria bacterium]|nr:dihydroorotase [Alphaproteobacteria bacterium]